MLKTPSPHAKKSNAQFLAISQEELEIEDPCSVRESKKEPSHRLTLKDYLRLNGIAKRSSSNSMSRKRKGSIAETPPSAAILNNTSLQTESPKQIKGSTQQSIGMLREEMKLDLNNCKKQLQALEENLQKHKPGLSNEEESYEQLVFLCKLNRILKETVLKGLELSSSMVSQKLDEDIRGFIGKFGQLTRQKSNRKLSTRSQRKSVQKKYPHSSYLIPQSEGKQIK